MKDRHISHQSPLFTYHYHGTPLHKTGGMVNTPASVMHALRGRQWCPLQRKWIRYAFLHIHAWMDRHMHMRVSKRDPNLLFPVHKLPSRCMHSPPLPLLITYTHTNRYDLQEEARRVLGVDIDVTAPVPPAPDTVTPSAAAVVDEEGKEEQSGGGKKGEGGGKGGGKASSLSLYAVLGVEPSAGQEAIKRAYYRVGACRCMYEEGAD